MPNPTFSPRATAAAGFLTLFTAMAAHAGDISVDDAYFRAAGASAMSGAAFMHITNSGAEADRLIAASSDVARKVELHTHEVDSNGVAMMRQVEDGFEVPAGAMRALERGGDHVMFMGLTRSLADGDVVSVTLTFEKAGDITIDVPIDNDRKPMSHGN